MSDYDSSLADVANGKVVGAAPVAPRNPLIDAANGVGGASYMTGGVGEQTSSLSRRMNLLSEETGDMLSPDALLALAQQQTDDYTMLEGASGAVTQAQYVAKAAEFNGMKDDEKMSMWSGLTTEQQTLLADAGAISPDMQRQREDANRTVVSQGMEKIGAVASPVGDQAGTAMEWLGIAGDTIAGRPWRAQSDMQAPETLARSQGLMDRQARQDLERDGITMTDDQWDQMRFRYFDTYRHDYVASGSDGDSGIERMWKGGVKLSGMSGGLIGGIGKLVGYTDEGNVEAEDFNATEASGAQVPEEIFEKYEQRMLALAQTPDYELSWQQAWHRTATGEQFIPASTQLFAQNMMGGTDSEQFDVALHLARGGKLEEYIANVEGMDPTNPNYQDRYAELRSLEADQGFKDAVALMSSQESRVSLGRSWAEGWGIDETSKLYTMVSGSTDALATLSLDPTLAAGRAVKTVKSFKWAISSIEDLRQVRRMADLGIHLEQTGRAVEGVHVLDGLSDGAKQASQMRKSKVILNKLSNERQLGDAQPLFDEVTGEATDYLRNNYDSVLSMYDEASTKTATKIYGRGQRVYREALYEIDETRAALHNSVNFDQVRGGLRGSVDRYKMGLARKQYNAAQQIADAFVAARANPEAPAFIELLRSQPNLIRGLDAMMDFDKRLATRIGGKSGIETAGDVFDFYEDAAGWAGLAKGSLTNTSLSNNLMELPRLSAGRSNLRHFTNAATDMFDWARTAGGHVDDAVTAADKLKYNVTRPVRGAGKLAYGLTHQVPMSAALPLLGDDAVLEFNKMLSMGAFADMPKARLDHYLEEFIKGGIKAVDTEGFPALTVGSRMGTAKTFMKELFEHGKLYDDPKLADWADEMLRKMTTHRYSADNIDVVTRAGQPTRMGILPFSHWSAQMEMPNYAKLTGNVKRLGFINRSLGVVNNGTIDGFMGAAWKPAMLLRLGFIPRAAGEELLSFVSRMGLEGIEGMLGSASGSDSQSVLGWMEKHLRGSDFGKVFGNAKDAYKEFDDVALKAKRSERLTQGADELDLIPDIDLQTKAYAYREARHFNNWSSWAKASAEQYGFTPNVFDRVGFWANWHAAHTSSLIKRAEFRMLRPNMQGSVLAAFVNPSDPIGLQDLYRGAARLNDASLRLFRSPLVNTAFAEHVSGTGSWMFEAKDLPSTSLIQVRGSAWDKEGSVRDLRMTTNNEYEEVVVGADNAAVAKSKYGQVLFQRGQDPGSVAAGEAWAGAIHADVLTNDLGPALGARGWAGRDLDRVTPIAPGSADDLRGGVPVSGPSPAADMGSMPTNTAAAAPVEATPLDTAREWVTANQKATIDGIRDATGLSKAKANDLLRQLEAEGVVGPVRAGKSREVLIEAPPAAAAPEVSAPMAGGAGDDLDAKLAGFTGRAVYDPEFAAGMVNKGQGPENEIGQFILYTGNASKKALKAAGYSEYDIERTLQLLEDNGMAKAVGNRFKVTAYYDESGQVVKLGEGEKMPAGFDAKERHEVKEAIANRPAPEPEAPAVEAVIPEAATPPAGVDPATGEVLTPAASAAPEVELPVNEKGLRVQQAGARAFTPEEMDELKVAEGMFDAAKKRSLDPRGGSIADGGFRDMDKAQRKYDQIVVRTDVERPAYQAPAPAAPTAVEVPPPLVDDAARAADPVGADTVQRKAVLTEELADLDKEIAIHYSARPPDGKIDDAMLEWEAKNLELSDQREELLAAMQSKPTVWADAGAGLGQPPLEGALAGRPTITWEASPIDRVIDPDLDEALAAAHALQDKIQALPKRRIDGIREVLSDSSWVPERMYPMSDVAIERATANLETRYPQLYRTLRDSPPNSAIERWVFNTQGQTISSAGPEELKIMDTLLGVDRGHATALAGDARIVVHDDVAMTMEARRLVRARMEDPKYAVRVRDNDRQRVLGSTGETVVNPMEEGLVRYYPILVDQTTLDEIAEMSPVDRVKLVAGLRLNEDRAKVLTQMMEEWQTPFQEAMVADRVTKAGNLNPFGTMALENYDDARAIADALDFWPAKNGAKVVSVGARDLTDPLKAVTFADKVGQPVKVAELNTPVYRMNAAHQARALPIDQHRLSRFGDYVTSGPLQSDAAAEHADVIVEDWKHHFMNEGSVMHETATPMVQGTLSMSDVMNMPDARLPKRFTAPVEFAVDSNVWEKVVRWGFDGVIGPAISSLVRKPMFLTNFADGLEAAAPLARMLRDEGLYQAGTKAAGRSIEDLRTFWWNIEDFARADIHTVDDLRRHLPRVGNDGKVHPDALRRDPIGAKLAELDDDDLDLARRLMTHDESVEKSVLETATGRAVNASIPYIDDHKVRSFYQSYARNIMPFQFAQEAFLKRWARTLVHSPEALQRAQLLAHGFTQSGMVHKNERGEDVFVIPASEALQHLMTNPATNALFGGHAEIPVTASLTGEVSSMMPGIPGDLQRLPSMGPVVQLPLNFASNFFPELHDAMEGLNGAGSTERTPAEGLLPGWARNLFGGMTGFEAQAEINRASIGAMQLMEAEAIRLRLEGDSLADAGKSEEALAKYSRANELSVEDDAEPAEVDEYLDNVKAWAQSLLVTRGIVGFFSPASPHAEFEGEELDAEFKEMLSNGMEFNEAIAVFLAEHPDAGPSTIFTSNRASKAPLPATVEAGKWMTENREFLEAFPMAAPWLMPQSKAGDTFERKTYSDGFAQELRTLKSPDEWIMDWKFAAGADEYFKNKARFDAAYMSAPDNDDYKRALRDHWNGWAEQYKLQHPLFAEGLNADSSIQKQRILGQLIEVLGEPGENPALPEIAHEAPMREMLASYQRYQLAYEEASAKNTKANIARKEQMKQAFSNWGETYILANPEVATLWRTLIESAADLREDRVARETLAQQQMVSN